MAETGLKIDFETLDLFLRVAIEGREFAKFEFTRNLSRALEDIVEFGDQWELSRDILSHLALDDLNATRIGHNAHNASVILSERAEQNRLSHQLNFAVELPPLLVTEMDFRVFELADSQPNFITQKDITGLIADLSDDNILDEFAGRIALIPQADPGYDWLFGQGIVGMITLYGGVNSHMAIRAAEFGLPAAIGVGAAEFEKLRLAKVIQLDCEGKRINVIR
jgi:glutamine kinase